MTETSTPASVGSETGAVASSPVHDPVAPRGSRLTMLALVIAVCALLLHFYVQIRHEVEKHMGPLPWLPVRIQSGFDASTYDSKSGGLLGSLFTARFSEIDTDIADLRQTTAKTQQDLMQAKADIVRLGQVADQSMAKATGVETAVTALRETADRSAGDVAKLSTVVADLRTAVDQSAALKTELSQAVDTMRRVETATSDMGRKLEALNQDVQSSKTEAEAATSKLSAQVQALSSANAAPLLAIRLAISANAGSVDPADIAALTALQPMTPALGDALTQLKALAGGDIQSFTPLRDSFMKRQSSAIAAARAARLKWWELPVSYARYTLADLGMGRPPEQDMDQLVVDEAIEQLNGGHLAKALEKLQGASPELLRELAPWISAAKLRVSLDQAVLEAIDALLTQAAPQQAQPAPG